VVPIDRDVGPDELLVFSRDFEALDLAAIRSFETVCIAEAESNAVVLLLEAAVDRTAVLGVDVVDLGKRGQGKGYSGVENELFFADNANLVYGDAQKVMVSMIQAVKSLEGGH
jgi:hypothetical protein